MPRLDPVRLAADVLEVLRTALRPVLTRLAAVDTRIADLERRTTDPPTAAALVALAGDVGAVRERLAAVEARPALPGPVGDRGADGIGFADPPLVYDGVRTFTFCFANGVQVVLTPPLVVYQGVYVAGRPYAPGDVVTAGGNLWHCNQSTQLRPGNDVGAWTLMVRRGKDWKGPDR
jgi:hypothetical protein